MKFMRKAPRGQGVRDECSQLTLTAEGPDDINLITAFMKFVCNDKPGDRRVADVSRACTTWAEPRLP